jgi:hypothetical protein
MPADGGDDPPELEIPARQTGEYVESIVEAAERAASKIRADAEAEARRYLDEYKRRIDGMVEERTKATDALVQQANKVRDQYDRFMSTVDSALHSSGGNGSQREPREHPEPREPEPAARPSRRQPARSEAKVAPPTPPGTTRGGFRPRTKIARANALAAQMAAAGSDRKAIARRLRDELGVDDADEVLDKLDFS